MGKFFVRIGTLPAGTRVRTESGTEATLLYASTCRARVRVGGARVKSITAKVADVTGEQEVTRTFSAPALETDWSAGTEVEVLSSAGCDGGEAK